MTFLRLLSTICLVLLLEHVQLAAQSIVIREELIFVGERLLASTHITTMDGGTMMVSRMSDSTTFEENLVFIKLSASGSVQWYRRYGPVYYGCENVSKTIDSGFAVSIREPVGVDLIIKVIKLDKTGNINFVKSIYPPSGYTIFDEPQIIARNDSDMNVVHLLLNASMNILVRNIVTLDYYGNLLWSHSYRPYEGKSLNRDTDTCTNGDIILAGTFFDTTTMCQFPVLSRISPNGTLLWTKYYAAAPRYFYTSSVVVMPGDFIEILAITSNPNTQTTEHAVIRTDGSGNPVWSYLYWYQAVLLTSASLDPAENNNVMLSGNSGSYHAAIKLDSSGGITYSREYPGVYFHSMDTTAGGMYSFAAMNPVTYRMMFATTDWLGVACGDNNLQLAKTPLTVQAIATGSDTIIPVVVMQDHIQEQYKPLYINVVCSPIGIQETENAFNVSVYPSPVSDYLLIESEQVPEYIELFDVTGKSVLKYKPDNALTQIEVASYPAGIYILKVDLRDGQFVSQVNLIH